MILVTIHPIGQYQDQIVPQTKYGFNYPTELIAKNITRLTDQLWKLIPMRENDEDWMKQLDTVTLEISGLSEIFLRNPLFLQLLAKLEGIRSAEPNFPLYRKTVFECISLIQGIKNGL